MVDEYVNEFVRDDSEVENRTLRLTFFSEYKQNGIVYRAHNDFRKSGPWYDWVMVRWDHHWQLVTGRLMLPRLAMLLMVTAPKNRKHFITPLPGYWDF